jgi:hypothetical protein
MAKPAIAKALEGMDGPDMGPLNNEDAAHGAPDPTRHASKAMMDAVKDGDHEHFHKALHSFMDLRESAPHAEASHKGHKPALTVTMFHHPSKEA